MQHKISVTILAKNAQATLAECLRSVKDFDEVVLLDNQSTDETLKIAKEFANVRIYQSEFIGFGPLKNLAVSYARNEWILSLDSDEVLEKSLLEEIDKTNFQKGHYYSFLRKNLYQGVWIKGCGWHPDWVKRIFNKTEITFDHAMVHEGLLIPKGFQEIRLKQGGIKHFSFSNITDLLDKLQRYSSLWAMQNRYKTSSPSKAIFRGLWTFLRNYIFKRGVLYGYKGFVISVCNGLGAFFKYMKLYENRLQKPNVSLIVTTYNQKERLAMVLDSIKHQEILPQEVLIADDGSTKETKEMIEQYQKDFPIPLKHIWQEDCGYRLSKSRNQAIQNAQAEYIVMIDGDMILHSSFIKDHQEMAKKQCFIQGGRIILDKERTELVLGSQNFSQAFCKKSLKALRLPWLTSLVFNLFVYKKKNIQENKFLPVRGCNMAFFKEDAQRINGFNEDFVGWGREDSEFVVRFLNNGGEMRKLKFAGIAYHLWHQENPREMLESNHRIYIQAIRENKKYCFNGLIGGRAR